MVAAISSVSDDTKADPEETLVMLSHAAIASYTRSLLPHVMFLLRSRMAHGRRESLARIHLEQLVQSVDEYIGELDKLMGVPPCHERGERQALLLNNLEVAKNLAKSLGLEKAKAKRQSRSKSGIREIERPHHDHP